MFVSGGGDLYVENVRSRKVERVFSVQGDIIGPPQLTRDGREAYFSRRVTEGDIWLLTLTFGLLSGLVLSGMMLALLPLQNRIHSVLLGYASMLAGFLLIWFGIRSYRDNVAGGSVRFGRAFAVGSLIALLSSLCYTATWEVYYFGVGTDFIAKYQAHQIAEAREKGATQAELDAKAAEMKKFAEMYENPLINSAMTLMEPLPLGLLVALISAGLLSRKRRVATDEPEGATARSA